MSNKFSMKTRITSYDVGPVRELKPSSVLRMMQEVAGRHMEQGGLSYEFMREKGIVFLLAEQAVCVKALPHCDEEIIVETWFERTLGVKFLRNMRFYDASGSLLIEAATHWITADPETHRILRPKAFPLQMPEPDDETVNAQFYRIELPPTAENAGTRTVRWSDIDCNSHMNNSIYADLICDFFPGGLGSRELGYFQIEFHGEAALGDEIAIKTAFGENSLVLFEGTIGEKKCFRACARAE